MFKAVDKIREAVLNLEASLQNEDVNQTVKQVKKILDISSNMYKQLKDVEENMVEDDDSSKIDVFEHTSSLDFLYKPTTVENYYDGNYLELFAERRSRDLKSSRALMIHNKFWTANSVVYGNVFGSIPSDLVDKDAQEALINYGWKKVLVHVYEIKDELEYTKLYDICKNNFNKYLIVSEKKNNTNLVLVFNT